jgi:ABC-2 type transport system permease protein
MSHSRPIGTLRAVALFGRVGALRWRNRLAAGLRPKKRAAPGAAPEARRTGTSRKRAVGLVGLIVIGVFMLFVSSLQATAAVRKVYAEGQDLFFLRPNLHRWVERYADKLDPASSCTPAERRAAEETLRGMLGRRVLLDRPTFTDDERDEFVDVIVERLQRRGLSAFALDAPVPFAGPREVPWSRGPDDPEVPLRQRRVAWLFALCGAVGLLTSLGGSVQDLGKVDWSFEWLAGSPLRDRTLFWGKLAEYVLVSPLTWFLTLPVALAVFLLRGWSVAALPLALFAALWMAALVGALRLVLETSLRMRIANLKNVQAVLTVAGSMLFVCLLWLSNAPELPTWFEVLSRVVPAELTLFGHVAFVLSSPRAAALWLPLLVLEAVLAAWLAVAWCARATSGGLLVGSGVHQGRRGQDKQRVEAGAFGSERGPAWLRGALRKDLLLLARDRAFLAQTLIVPLLVVAIQIVLNRSLLGLLAGNSNHAAAFAFGLGAYMLIFSAASILSVEGNALWILLSSPQPLDRVLRRKATLWAALGTLYTLGGIALLLWIGRAPEARGWVAFATAIAGIPIYAFIAAGLGVLATDPLEQEVRRRVAPSTIYLYMVLVAMYATSIYTEQLHVKFVQIVLSALLAYALWQRVRDRIPYLLDPTEAPPPRLGLSDGLLATLAFLALQAFFAFSLPSHGLGTGLHLLISFVASGFVVAVASLYLLRRAGIADLHATLGIARAIEGARAAWKCVCLGVVAGGLVSLLGLAYVGYIASQEKLRKLLEPPEGLELLAQERLPFALVAIVAAPLVEEFLFRGMVFRGMQRSIGTGWAVLGSAAVFAAVHPPIAALPVFVLGVVAALVFQRGGRLWGAIACHMTYNAIVVGMSLLSQQGTPP